MYAQVRFAGLAAVGSAAVALGALAAPAAAGAAPASQQRTTVFASRLWKLQAITMDGSNVAVARHALLETFPPHQRPTFKGCDEVDLVNARSGRLVRLSLRSRGDYCDDGGFGGSEASSFLALAGSHAYWVYEGAGNNLYQTLFTGAPGSAQRTLLGPSSGYRDTGPFIGPLAASGTTFAYSGYARPWLPIGCDPFHGEQCTLSGPTDFTLTVHGSRVALPSPGGVVASVDDTGHAAVMLSSKGRVAIVARNAQTTITMPIPGVTGRVVDAALDGRWLAVLASRRIWAFDSQNGHLRGVWPAKGATHVDVWNGIAVVATRRQVIAVRLSNGHRLVLQQLGRGRRFVGGAQIEAGGVVWATQPVRDAGNGLNAIFRVPVPHLR